MPVRKSNRKGSRRNTRRNRRGSRRNMYGGALTLSPMELTDTSMMSASKMSGGQGLDFLNKHVAQHGGGALMGAPVGDTGMLDASLRGAARVMPLDASISDAVSKGQAGGRRRGRGHGRYHHGGRRGSRRGSRRTRRQNGGSAPVNAPGMLLSGSQASAALSTMHKDWVRAENPNWLGPKLAGY